MNKNKKSLSAFSIIFLILLMVALITRFLPQLSKESLDILSSSIPENIDKEALISITRTKINAANGVKGASFSSVFMSIYNGFESSRGIVIFILMLGGLLGILDKTGALKSGVVALIKKLKGRELLLIPILMTLLSIGGTSYGMAEETIAFYGVICATMVASGLDTMVAVGTIVLGAGVGVLGSTINPFSTGIAINISRDSGVSINGNLVLILGSILWISSLIIAIIFVMNYAKKIKRDKGSIILSLQEVKDMEENFSNLDVENTKFTLIHKITLLLYAFNFLVIIVSLISWEDFGINFFLGWSEFLTGTPLGRWYFSELAMWVTFVGLTMALINRFDERTLINSFIDGVKDSVPVILIIILSRGVSVLMTETYLDKYILNIVSYSISGFGAILYAPLTYILYMFLSFFVPSTSGLATISIPILSPLTSQLGFSPEVTIVTFASACGLLNLIAPTAGALVGGLAAAKVEYSSYVKWSLKLIGIIAIANMIIVTVAMLVIK